MCDLTLILVAGGAGINAAGVDSPQGERHRGIASCCMVFVIVVSAQRLTMFCIKAQSQLREAQGRIQAAGKEKLALEAAVREACSMIEDVQTRRK